VKEKYNRSFKRHLFWTMMFGFGYGAMRYRTRRHCTVCKGELGRIQYFGGREVCELFDINKISKITQMENGNVHMLATLDGGKKIYTDPITLERFKKKFFVEKRCSGNFCEFKKSSL